MKSVWQKLHSQRLDIRDRILNFPFGMKSRSDETIAERMWLWYSLVDTVRDAVEDDLVEGGVSKSFGYD